MAEGGAFPPVLIELKAKATELKASLSEARTELSETAKESETSSSRMGSAMQKASGYGKTLAFGLAGVAATVGAFSVEAAVAGQKVDAQLATAIHNAGGSMEELEPKIGSVDSKLRGFGFTNEETNAALTRLTVATKDPEKALNAVGVAADLARSRNIPLATATDLVAKAMAGQTGALTRMGISLPVAAGGAQKVTAAQQALAKAQDGVNAVLAKYPNAANAASKGHAAYEAATQKVTDAQKKLQDAQSAGGNILTALESRVKGAASAYGDTLAGKMAAARAQVDNIGEALGKRLIPIITSALGAASKFIGWLNDHTPVLYSVAGVIGTVMVTAIGAYIASLVKAQLETVAKLALMVAGWLGYSAESSAAAAEGAAASEASILSQFTTMVGAAASGFASMIASAAGWIATQATQLAESAAGFIAWAAEHAAMAAGYIAENIAMAASATAAFIAENAATLGIVAAIGLVVAGIVWLATHWGQAWDAIKNAALWAYNNAIKPVADWINSNAIQPISGAISWLGQVWGQIWGGIKKVIQDVGGVIGSILGGIVSGISTMIGWIQKAIGWFENLFSSANTANTAASRAAQSGARAAQVASTNFSNSLIGSNLTGAYGPSKDVGGWIYEVPKGQPLRMTGHGGEYVLSLDMLAGRQQIDPAVVGAISGQAKTPTQQALTGGQSPSPAANGTTINNNVAVQTNADPQQIANAIGWKLMAMA